jgi:Ser/Thr protein kinase RdoA (MazF antagonist)
LLKYRENAVFAVRAVDGRRNVLRVHRPRYRTDDHIRSELTWMQALAADGIATPGVIATKSGDTIARVDADGFPEPRQCDLLAWVEGQPLGTGSGRRSR